MSVAGSERCRPALPPRPGPVRPTLCKPRPHSTAAFHPLLYRIIIIKGISVIKRILLLRVISFNSVLSHTSGCFKLFYPNLSKSKCLATRLLFKDGPFAFHECRSVVGETVLRVLSTFLLFTAANILGTFLTRLSTSIFRFFPRLFLCCSLVKLLSIPQFYLYLQVVLPTYTWT